MGLFNFVSTTVHNSRPTDEELRHLGWEASVSNTSLNRAKRGAIRHEQVHDWDNSCKEGVAQQSEMHTAMHVQGTDFQTCSLGAARLV